MYQSPAVGFMPPGLRSRFLSEVAAIGRIADHIFAARNCTMIRLILGLSLMLGLAGLGGWLLSTIPSVAGATSQKIAVPSYFYPDGENGLWAQMEAASPPVGLAIINPFNGPGATKNEDYVNQVISSKEAGLTVLGYVHSSYADRPIGEVKTDIENHYYWYNVDGIFVDEVPTDCSYAGYYEGLYGYIKGIGGPAATVVLNPGTRSNDCYMDVSDILLTFEDTYRVYKQIAWPPGWEAGYSADRFWHLVHGTQKIDQMKNAIILSKERHAGWVYVTPDKGGNPWDALPSGEYWTEELNAVQGEPTGNNSPPTVSITSPADSSTFASGATIPFQGTASDPEDGDLPAGLVWTSSIDGQIGTGGSFSTTLGDGNHNVTASVADSGGATGSAAISINVGTQPSLILEVTLNKEGKLPSYRKGEVVAITGHVTDDTSPPNSVQGAAVHFQFTTANGGPLTCDITTNSNGDAICTYRVKAKRDGYGPYIVEVTASKSGYNSSPTVTKTFNVE